MQSSPDIPKTPLAFFLYASKKHSFWMWTAIVAVVVSSAAGQSTSYFFKLIIDAVEVGDSEKALMWGLLYPVAVFVVQLLYRVSGYAGALWTTGAHKTGFDGLTEHLLLHSHGYFTNRFAGSVTSKVRNVVGALDETIPDFLWGQLSALVSFFVTFCFILSVDVLSALLFISLIVILLFVNQIIGKKKAILARKNAEATTALQGRLVDVLSNVSTVRQYVRNDFEQNGIKELSTGKLEASRDNWFYTERMLLINGFVLFIFSFFIFWLLVIKWSEGQMSTGDFVLILALVSQITGTLLFIGRAFNNTARTIGEMKEGLDDLMVPYEVTDTQEAKPLVMDGGLIQWDDVSFSFDNNLIFNEFNLTIQPGQRIGLVGPSGAGKSTFVSLLLRQVDISSGAIRIDNQNIAEVTQDSLRKAISVVPQEPALFHRTIRENIAYGNDDATDEEIFEVAKKAQAHGFISKLPLGYDTMVGERGVKLSGGQKQRVAIARAMLKNAPVLILDEATSALDSESEVSIQKALHILMEGKTVVAIAHRLSTLREMDRIIVLEAGRVVEDGNHELLKRAGGVYQRLWEHQAGGFVGE